MTESIKKRTQFQIYQPKFSEHSSKSVQDKIQGFYEAIYDLDTLISRLAYELNRSQRLLPPRLSIPFLKNRRVMNYGFDIEPVWCWQNYNSEEKKWFVRKVDKPHEFDPQIYFKMKRTSEIIGGNRRVTGRLIKEISNLLILRNEMMKEMVAIKRKTGLLEKQIQNHIRKKEPVVELLKGRVVARNFVIPNFVRQKKPS